MPKYSYRCEKCSNDFIVVHSMSKKYKSCNEIQEIDCDEEGSLERIPSSFMLATSSTNSKTKQKTGEVVKKSIQEFKEDLKEQRKELSNKTYDNN